MWNYFTIILDLTIMNNNKSCMLCFLIARCKDDVISLYIFKNMLFYKYFKKIMLILH